MSKKKLAIVTTHPIQYNGPLFKLLADRGNIALKVFYTWPQGAHSVDDKGFGKEIQWDIPLLEGYTYEFLENTSRTPGNRSYTGIRNPNIIQKIKEYNPHAVLVYGWNFESHYHVMRYFKGKLPVWFRGDSHLLDERPGPRTWIRRIVLRRVYKNIDKAFYVGINNKAYFLKHGLKENQLVYAPHAIDNDRFSDNKERNYEEKALQWRKELGYDECDVVILFAGKFEPKKNPGLLIKAFNTALKLKGKIKLLMVGNGIMEDELKKAAAENSSIRFLPFQNQLHMPVLYRVGDIFCLPSRGPGETWGLAVNESLACGRPVIISRKVGCAEDLIKDDIIGWHLNDIDDAEELARIISEMSTRIVKEEGAQIRRQKFIQNWSYDSLCHAIERNICQNFEC